MAVDHNALEAKVAGTAPDFGSRPIRVLRRDGCHADKACRVRGTAVSQMIISAADHRLGLAHVQQRLHAGRCERQDGDVDAGRIHIGQPPIAQIQQAVDNLGSARGRRLPVKAPERRHAPVRTAIAHHAQIGVDLLSCRESLLGRDAQIAAIAAGF